MEYWRESNSLPAILLVHLYPLSLSLVAMTHLQSVSRGKVKIKWN